MNLDQSVPRANASPIVSLEQKLNIIARRFFLLSPTVELGLERECTKLDFNQVGDKPVGRGGFGEVWKVIHRDTNKTYCIKLIDKRDMIEQKLINQLNIELEIMYKIHHPHSVKLVNHFEDEDKLYIIMLFAPKGTVFSHLKKNQKLDQSTAAQFIRDTLSIVKYLHSFSPKIIHRDIKPENLLLDDNYRIKLCDYGWACYQSEGEKLKTFCGTPEYVSPEMIKKQGHDYRVDIWSIGVLLFELLAGYTPFFATSRDEIFSNVSKVKINWPNDFPVLAKNLVLRILKHNPNDRPSLEEISEHPWLKENPPIKDELVYPSSTKKANLISHMVNSTSKPDHAIEQPLGFDVSPLNKLEFKKRSDTALTKISSKDLENDYTVNLERIKNENKELKIQMINTDNLYTEALKENERLLQFKKDFEELQKDYAAITKELALYKEREKDREALIEDSLDKATHILILQQEIAKHKLEQFSYDALTEKVKALNASMQFKDRMISDLTEELNKLTKQHQETSESITTVNTESSLSNTITLTEPQIDKPDMEALITKLSSQLTEKISTMNHKIEANLALFKNKDKEIASMISHMSKEITTVISIVKESMIQHITALFDKFSFKSMKTYETINWLSQKNQELQEQIGSNERMKDQLETAKAQVNLLKQSINVFLRKEETDSLKINQLASNLAGKDAVISSLEVRLSDMKNFIFKNSNNEIMDRFSLQFKSPL